MLPVSFFSNPAYFKTSIYFVSIIKQIFIEVDYKNRAESSTSG